MDLTVEVYECRCALPPSEAPAHRRSSRGRRLRFRRTSRREMRVAPRDYAHFLSIARGRVLEVETFLMLAARLGLRRRRSWPDPRPDRRDHCQLMLACATGPASSARSSQSPVPSSLFPVPSPSRAVHHQGVAHLRAPPRAARAPGAAGAGSPRAAGDPDRDGDAGGAAGGRRARALDLAGELLRHFAAAEGRGVAAAGR